MIKNLSKTPAAVNSVHPFSTDHLKTNLKSRTVRGGTITITTQVSKIVLQTASTIVLARLLTPEDYGLIGMVKAVTGLISLFKDLGLSMATVQRTQINHNQVSTLFWINVAVSLLLAVITASLGPVVAWFYSEPRLIWIMFALATGYVFSGTGGQHKALLDRQMRYSTIAIIDIVSFLISIVVAVVSAYFGAKYWALVFMALTNAVAHTAGYWLMSGWLPGLPKRNSGVRSMLSFGGGLTASTIATYTTRNLDNVLIGWYWGAQELGLYTRAYQLLVLPLISINSPIRSVAINALSRLKDSPSRYRKAYMRILEKIIVITMPGVVFLMATSDWLIVFLLGPQWSDVSRIFGWLSLVALALPVNYTLGWLLISQDRTWEMFRVWTITSLISVAGFIVGLPWGATGIAAAYALSELFITTPLRFWCVSRKGPVGIRNLYETIVPPWCASLGALIVLLTFRRCVEVNSPLSGLIMAFIITVVTTLLILLLFPAGRRALQDFKNVLALRKGGN